MFLLAQVPDPTQVIDRAIGVSWEAGMLAVVMVSCMSALTYLIHRQNKNTSEERALMAEREKRMATRIDALEDEMRKIEREHSQKLLDTIKEVTACILESKEESARMRETLARIDGTMSTVNGDLRELCELLKMSPCLVATMHRGEVKLVDKDGNEIKMTRSDKS